MTRTASRARAGLTDATIVATYIDTAMSALRDARGGYPSSTPGAAPSTNPPATNPDTTPLTVTERNALTKDPAARDFLALCLAVQRFQHHAAIAATIAARWGSPGMNAADVAKQLATIDQNIWCANCSRHGQRNPRRPGKTECEFCQSFRLSYGLPADAAIWGLRDAQHGRIYVQHIERILDRDHPGWRKTRPKQKRKKD
jgi:hypothetical protein